MDLTEREVAEAAVKAGATADEIMQKMAEHKGCETDSDGGKKASCGTAAGENDLAPEIWEKVKNHPATAKKRITITPACTWLSRPLATFSATTATASMIAPTNRVLASSPSV